MLQFQSTKAKKYGNHTLSIIYGISVCNFAEINCALSMFCNDSLEVYLQDNRSDRYQYHQSTWPGSDGLNAG